MGSDIRRASYNHLKADSGCTETGLLLLAELLKEEIGRKVLPLPEIRRTDGNGKSCCFRLTRRCAQGQQLSCVYNGCWFAVDLMVVRQGLRCSYGYKSGFSDC